MTYKNNVMYHGDQVMICADVPSHDSLVNFYNGVCEIIKYGGEIETGN